MLDYKASVDEILFALRHGADVRRLGDWDDALAEEILGHLGHLINDTIAPLDPVGDREGCRLTASRVRMPAGFRDAYRAYSGGGWPGMAVATDHGGMALPGVFNTAMTEMLAGACVSFQMVVSLAQGAIRTLEANGSLEQQTHYIPVLASGDWLATMCLTEADAGSDLSRIRTRAVKSGEDWRITGEKIFISGGDQDMSDGVLHLVLARTGAVEDGSRGLSLFLCPAHNRDGARNGVTVLRLEEKMGMHASPTCQLAFDDAQAELLGKEGQGLKAMFTMMNHARLDVAAQGIGLAEAAGQRARAYAVTRVQGRVPDAAPGHPITGHSDVRRLLLHQLALTIGCRALVYRMQVELDLDPHAPLATFLTPVCKVAGSEASVECAQAAIQIHGGYGYLREYRVEQLFRDARIGQIYEGTNGIQAATLATRMLRVDNGRPLEAFRSHVAETLAECSGDADGTQLQSAFEDWTRATAAVIERRDPTPVADSYMQLTATLALGAIWARLERHADAAPNPARIVETARYMRERLLPQTALWREHCLIAPHGDIVSNEIFSDA